MAASTNIQEVHAAWRALAGSREGEGWKTISVKTNAPCALLAGRHMPGDEEAVLVGFNSIGMIHKSDLPQGHGFEVTRLGDDPTGGNRTWVALARRTAGSPELFTLMVEDLVRLLEDSTTPDEFSLLRRFLLRIRAWQDFMDRHKEGVLSPEAELGLFGELVLLDRVIEAGMQAYSVLDAWQGPLDGLQDFMLGDGGIEVKTTLSVGGFPATISSLEQLDDSLRQPLFIAGVRLKLDPKGITLPEMADVVRTRLQDNQAATDVFEVRLVQAGLLKSRADRYSRRFVDASLVLLPLRDGFPRLTRTVVHLAVRKARYEIDLDLTGAANVGLSQALKILGVI